MGSRAANLPSSKLKKQAVVRAGHTAVFSDFPTCLSGEGRLRALLEAILLPTGYLLETSTFSSVICPYHRH